MISLISLRNAAGGLALALLAGALAGQAPNPQRAASLHGLVQTGKGEPVEGARVELQGTGLSTVSRPDGSFRIDGVPPGRYWLTVARASLDPSRRTVTLEPEEERQLEFVLEPAAPPVSAARAAAMDRQFREFAERLRNSLDGVFLTQDDITRSRQPQLGAVLSHYLVQTTPRSGVRAAPGCAPYESWVWAGSGRSAFDWSSYPYISVNGERPFRGRALYEFDPADVIAVEFYRGAGPSFGYLPTSAQCGLAIVWTK